MAITALRVELGPTPDGETFTPALTGIEHRLIDLVPAYEAIAAAFRRIEQRRFDSEGPGWAELAASTVAQRERLGIGGSHPILSRKGIVDRGRRGGQLRTSLTTKGAKNSVVRPEVDGLFVGTADPVAKYHQEGTAKMPARPLVDLNEADAAVFGGIIGEYVFDFGVDRTILGDAMFVADVMGL